MGVRHSNITKNALALLKHSKNSKYDKLICRKILQQWNYSVELGEGRKGIENDRESGNKDMY
jgi:hypothetical protein